jgi:ATP-binding cassette subfamily F protein 3
VASPDLVVGNFAQLEVDRLDARDTALIALTNRIDQLGVRSQWDEQRRRNHLGGFGFRGDRVFEPVVHFSAANAPGLRWPSWWPNAPTCCCSTNHQPSRLRDAAFADHRPAGLRGRVIVVSHDRGLLRSVCDQFWLVAMAWCATSMATSRTTPAGSRSAPGPRARRPHPSPATTIAGQPRKTAAQG